jgi:hypothetical protein
VKDSSHPSEIKLSARRLPLLLAGVVVFLAIGHTTVFVVRKAYDLTAAEMHGLLGFFDMGSEANLPTFVSGALLMLAAVLLVMVAKSQRHASRRQHLAWWGLAIGFCLLSVDEVAQVHEGLVGRVVEEMALFQSWPSYAWYLPYLPLLIILAILYLPFLSRLPRPTMTRFVVAGAVFLGGAIGIEFAEGLVSNSVGESANFGVLALSRLVEETAEMTGVVLFIRALLLFLADRGTPMQISVLPTAAESYRRKSAESDAPAVVGSTALPPLSQAG